MSHFKTARAALILVAIAGIAMLALQLTQSIAAHPLKDINGTTHGSLEHPAQGKWSVLFFLTPDCPIANQYAPEIRRICDTYDSRGAHCYLVYADPSLSTEAVRRHAHDFHASRYTILLDSDSGLVKAAGATVSSETAIFSNGGKLEYRGRIDNFHAALGTPRQQATQHDLREAMDALLAGRSVPNPRTETVGCFLPNQSPGASL